MSNKLNFKKELIGCFGSPIWENPTEAMMEAAFSHHGMKFRYVTTEVSANDLKTAFEGLKAMGFKGFNCTLPHKVAIIEHLDGLGESAKMIEAVNCVVERNGQYIGENTDGKGFLESLSKVIDPRGKNVILIGAGGAARAVSMELALAGAKSIVVVNRSEERGTNLVQLLEKKSSVMTSFHPLNGEFEIPDGTDILINSTSVGLYPNVQHCIPIKVSSLIPEMVVCDLIPNPPMTHFLKLAQSQGCTILDGLGMLVNQGKIGIKYWSGVDVDANIMREKLEELFST